MSNHLPECPGNWGVGQMPDGPCTFCDMLRGCEQRVLVAAREAASSLDEGPKNRLYWIDRENALIAIDALWRGVIFATMVAVPIIVLLFWLLACVLIPIGD